MELVSKRIGDIGRVQKKEIRLSRLFLRALADVPHSDIFTTRGSDSSQNAFKGNRSVYIGQNTWVDSRVYEWDFLCVPAVLDGPAIIESTDTTVLIPPKMTVEIDEHYNGIIGRCK